MCVDYGVIKVTSMVNKRLANPSKAACVAAFDLFSLVVNDTVTIKTRVAFPAF